MVISSFRRYPFTCRDARLVRPGDVVCSQFMSFLCSSDARAVRPYTLQRSVTLLPSDKKKPARPIASYDKSMDDVRNGRVYEYGSLDDFINEMG